MTAIFCFPNRPNSARLKGFLQFSLSCGANTVYAPKPGAIPTSLYPDIHFSAMIPRQAVKIKIFLSVVIPVVKATFVPLSAIGGNPVNAGAARLSGVSPCPVPDTATALPNHPRYQLRHTRLYLFFSLLPAYYLSDVRPRRFPQKHSRGSSLGALAPLLVSSPRSNAFFRLRRRHFSSPNCATPGYIYFLVCFLLISFPLSVRGASLRNIVA